MQCCNITTKTNNFSNLVFSLDCVKFEIECERFPIRKVKLHIQLSLVTFPTIELLQIVCAHANSLTQYVLLAELSSGFQKDVSGLCSSGLLLLSLLLQVKSLQLVLLSGDLFKVPESKYPSEERKLITYIQQLSTLNYIVQQQLSSS